MITLNLTNKEVLLLRNILEIATRPQHAAKQDLSNTDEQRILELLTILEYLYRGNLK